MFCFRVITLFPTLFESYCSTSIIGRGCSNGSLKIELYNPRDFCSDNYRRVDDTPYGGGAGMVMKPEPVFAAFDSIKRKADSPVLLTSPRGKPFKQKMAHLFSQTKEQEITIICGRYEGTDERISSLVTDEVSLGDFILTGGELAALTIIDAVSRLIPGVVGQANSLIDESFAHGDSSTPSLFQGILEAPQYTKPPEFRGMSVPEILRNGDHKAIAKWRRQEALRITFQRRPDLLEKAPLSIEDHKFLDSLKNSIG